MCYVIHECGYWSVVGSVISIFSWGDTLEEALDDFHDCFLEMKADFYDAVQPGFENVRDQYAWYIDG